MAPEQKSLIYSCIYHRTSARFIVEYINFEGNYTGIAKEFIPNIPSPTLLNPNNIFNYTSGELRFIYLFTDAYVYCVVALENAGIQLPINFLQHVEEDFTNRYVGYADLQYRPNQLKEHMESCVNRVEHIRSGNQVEARDLEVGDGMMEAIRTALGSKGKFEIHRIQWYETMRTKLVVIGVLTSMTLGTVIAACPWFYCGC